MHELFQEKIVMLFTNVTDADLWTVTSITKRELHKKPSCR